jgi:hypothetical protein
MSIFVEFEKRAPWSPVTISTHSSIRRYYKDTSMGEEFHLERRSALFFMIEEATHHPLII